MFHFKVSFCLLFMSIESILCCSLVTRLSPCIMQIQFILGFIQNKSTVVPIYKKKGSVMDCASYRGVKLLEHGMKVVERLLEKRLRRLVKVDQMQFGFMPGRSTVNAIFILRRMQESYLKKNRKLFNCFVDLEKAFDRVPRKVIE